MAVTTTPRLGLTRWSAGTDPLRRSQIDTSLGNLEAWAMRGEAGTLANRPAAGIRDRYYTDDATGVTYRDSGTAWTVVGANLAGLATVRGTAGQTGNLTEWRDAAGALLASAAVDGTLTGKALAASGLSSTVSPLTAQGASGQSAPLASFRNSAGTEVAAVSATGAGTFGTTAVTGTDPTTSPLTVKAAPAQTGTLQRWQDAAATLLASVDAAGRFTGSGANTIGVDPAATVVLVRGAVGQTGKLTAWQDSTGAEVANVDKAGALAATAGTFTAATTTANPLVVKGTASQSGDLAQWRNSANAVLASVKADGTMSIGANLGASALNVTAVAASLPVIRARQAVAHTGDTHRWENSAGTLLARVMVDGTIDAPNLKDSGDVTTVASVITGVVAATWTVGTVSVRKVGQVVDYYIDLTYNGAAIAAVADGNIPNVVVGTVAAAYRPRTNGHLAPCGMGVLAAFYVDSAGSMQLTAAPPGVALPTGSRWTLQGSWLTAAP